VSTINSYVWYLQAIPSKFLCATFQKKPLKYFSFCDTVFSSWGRSGRICYLPYCLFQKGKKREKKRKKGTHLWYVNVGGHPMESVSHGLRKEKRWGGVPSFIKRAQKCQSLSQKLASFLYGR
jgi:hypothetical protein